MSLRSNLYKFRARSWSERRLLLEAFAWLGLMRAAILLVSFQRIVVMFGLSAGQPTVSSTSNSSDPATLIGWAVKAAAVRTPWESVCLGQALAAMAMLHSRKIPGTLYLGVAKDATAPDMMAAHAWLVSGDAIVTGAAGRERYAVISSFSWPS